VLENIKKMGGVRSKTPRSLLKTRDFTLDEIAQKENEPSRMSLSVNCPSNNTSVLTHVSWPDVPDAQEGPYKPDKLDKPDKQIDRKTENSKEHFYVTAFRKRYQQEVLCMTTPHFHCLSKEERSFYDSTLLPDYVNKNIKFTRYVWEVKGSSDVKGYLSLFIAHDVIIEEDQKVIPNVCIGKFEARRRHNQPSQPASHTPRTSRGKTSKISTQELETEEVQALDITLSTPTSET